MFEADATIDGSSARVVVHRKVVVNVQTLASGAKKEKKNHAPLV